MSVAVMDGAAPPPPLFAGRLATALEQIAAAQRGRAFLWCAPALAAGSAAYFWLPFEPPMAVAGVALVVGLLGLWRGVAGRWLC